MADRIWIKSLTLENVRSFEGAHTIYFTDNGEEDGKPAQWNVILGDNGTGKTTVLKGVYISGLHRHSYNLFSGLNRTRVLKFDINSLWNIGNKSKFETKHPFMVQHMRSGPLLNIRGHATLVDDKIADEFVLKGYSANRAIGSKFKSEPAPDDFHSSNLFDENLELINAEQWLLDIDRASINNEMFKRDRDKTIYILEKLFEKENIKINIGNYYQWVRVLFSTPYGNIILSELSLGYRTLIAWVVDLARALYDKFPGSNDPLYDPLSEPAVCLVDEIDLHLHPKFQRQIIQFLTETFPNTQFIVTAHSPLIVQAAEDYNANLILLKREGDHTVVVNNPVEVRNWRIDQILSSELFDGVAARPPQAEANIERRRELIRKQKLNKAEKEELQKLEEEINNLPVLESKEAIEAIEILKKAARNLK